MGATAAAIEPISVLNKVRRTAYQKCIPINATFEITLRCNIRCHHCYNFDRSEPHRSPAAAQELSPTDILRIVNELADAGTLYLNLTGGESTLHPQLPEFIREARRRYMMVKVKTNGTRLDEARAREIASAGAYGTDISLYGFSEATYESFTRVRGAYARTLQGIEAARKAGLRVHISMCLMQSNVHELEKMIQFAQDRQFSFSVDPQITRRHDGTRSSADLRVDRDTLDRLYRGPLRDTLVIPESPSNVPPQCSCARSTCGISAFGEVFPCIGAPLASGNLREKSFSDIWRNSPVLNRIRGLTLDDFPTCKPCAFRSQCRRSSGAVYSNTGDYTGAEDWTCMEAEVLHSLSKENGRHRPPAKPPLGSLQRFSVELN